MTSALCRISIPICTQRSRCTLWTSRNEGLRHLVVVIKELGVLHSVIIRVEPSTIRPNIKVRRSMANPTAPCNRHRTVARIRVDVVAYHERYETSLLQRNVLPRPGSPTMTMISLFFSTTLPWGFAISSSNASSRACCSRMLRSLKLTVCSRWNWALCRVEGVVVLNRLFQNSHMSKTRPRV